MKRIAVLLASVAVMSVAAPASAQSIRGTMGLNLRAGVISPADSKESAGNGRDYLVDTDPGFIGEVGFIYGVDDHIAFEVNLQYSAFSTDSTHNDATMKDMSVGMQYRFPPANPKMTPYMGLGVDVLIPDYDKSSVDTVFGGHVRGGFDFFMDRNLVFNIDLKATGGFMADVDKGGKFDPSYVSTMAGFRYLFR